MVYHTRKIYRDTSVGAVEVTLSVYGKSDADAEADFLFNLLEPDIENSVAFAVKRVEEESEYGGEDEDDDEGTLSPCKCPRCHHPAA